MEEESVEHLSAETVENIDPSAASALVAKKSLILPLFSGSMKGTMVKGNKSVGAQSSQSRAPVTALKFKYICIHVLRIDPNTLAGVLMPDNSPMIGAILVSGPIVSEYDVKRFTGKLPFQRFLVNDTTGSGLSSGTLQFPLFENAGFTENKQVKAFTMNYCDSTFDKRLPSEVLLALPIKKVHRDLIMNLGDDKSYSSKYTIDNLCRVMVYYNDVLDENDVQYDTEFFVETSMKLSSKFLFYFI